MECDGCTLCCELLPIKALDKPPNEMCKHCKGGCTIFPDRPSECSLFECAYYQASDAPLKLRPDNCKVIFEKLSDQLFIGTLDARHEITETAMGQVKSFLSQGYSVIMGASDFRKPAVFIALGHNEEEIMKQWQTTELT